MLTYLSGLDTKLAGTPDDALTVALLLAAGVIAWAAFGASPAMKAAILCWVIAP